MSILDQDFDIDDDAMYRSVFLEYIVRESKYHQVILLLDPDNVVDMYQLRNKFPDNKDLYDMSQCQTGDYVDFVKKYVLPFVEGNINYLLLDNIDKIPDIDDKKDFETLLRYMAKREDYDAFRCLNAPVSDTKFTRMTIIDFAQVKGRLIMRCAEVPEFLQKFTYIMVDCRNYVQLVDEMLADEMSGDSQKQSTFAGRGNGKCGKVRPEDCIPPDGLKDLPSIGFPGSDLIDPETGNKIAEAEGYQP